MKIDIALIKRAQGCLMGQLAGDALGSLVEFQTPEEIQCKYPNGVRELVDGGTWNTIAGQPTDDSEMALLLSRMLVDMKTYDTKAARRAYKYWLASDPFDCGLTIATGLRGQPNPDSQANGALMRISPLGIFGAANPLEQVSEWARQDASLTHPHMVCQQVNSLFVRAIAHVIKTGIGPAELFKCIDAWASEMEVEPSVRATIQKGTETPPEEYVQQQGWVLIAFHNCLWQLLHAPNLEEGVVDTIMRGGDTDTNAAICGALLGAVYGFDSIPSQWTESVLNCRPEFGQPGVHRPRPVCFWPRDALALAKQLVTVSSNE